VFAVGLDLAWSPRNPSGLAIVARAGGTWVLRGARADLETNRNIVDAIEAAVGEGPAVVAIDAPLVVPHRTRGREGDRMTTRVFGSYDAAVYPATRRTIGRYGGRRIWDLVADLEARGLRQAPEFPRQSKDRVFFETYPHAAMIALFHLERVLKYKYRQGRSLEERRREFRALAAHLRSLEAFDPPLTGVEAFLVEDLDGMKGARLKAYEDRLDAILCAYIAAYYWTWGTERCAVFGDLEGGYIVTPFRDDLAARVIRGSRVVTYRGRRL